VILGGSATGNSTLARTAYVVGVPDQAREIVAAAVELRSGAATDTASIIAFCRERLASYKVSIRVDFRTAAQLPRTPTGKIHKPTLSQELAARPEP
jgi:acyl-CoA synthetase (AMP-forming)/AMP-acid ligase II